VDVTDEPVHEVVAAIEGLRATAASGRMPPPLEGSPKCNGCSLSGICMPDEINQLGFAKVKASRRLVPSESAAHPMYVTDPRCRVGREGGRVVVVRQGETLASERLIDVSQLCVFGNVQVSSQLVGELMSRCIPIMWFSFGGWLRGITEGLPSKHVELRRRQVHAVDESSSILGRRMIEGKIRNSRTLLRRNGRGVGAEVLESMRRLALKAGRAESVKVLLGYEGTAARLYFANFSKMLRGAKSLPGGSFDFTGRNRRPPRDAMNCLLSFSYALLTKDCFAALFSIGFDPYLGVLHRPRFGRPALALDLAEEFRPLIAESVALTLVNNGEIKESDFICRAGAVALTASGRRAALRVYERRLLSTVTHPTFGYQVTYRRAIEVQARVLAAVVLGELEAYQPMVTR
jgi:CRISPR-associated protein Cas1